MYSQILFLLAIVPLSTALLGIGRSQGVSVTGRLVCKGSPAGGVKLKLYEKEAILDSLLEETTSDGDGRFHLSGHKTEISTIDPKLNIYHKCEYSGPCYQKIGITIPDSHVNNGQTYDVGTLNLANEYTGSSTDCLN